MIRAFLVRRQDRKFLLNVMVAEISLECQQEKYNNM